MIKNIKTKETIKDIKTLDKKKTLDSFNKKQSINTKNNVQDEKENKESNYAINKIKSASEKTLVSARIKIKQYRSQKRKSEKFIKENSTKKGNIKLKNIKLSTAKNKINPRTNGNLSNTINQTLSNHTISQSRMLNKYRKSLNKFNGTTTMKYSGNKIIDFIKKLISFVKKSIAIMNHLISYGTGMIILIVIVLFIGVFSALSDDSSVNTSVEGLSSEVIAYTPVIEKYALESGIDDYVSLIQAVMMQESGGKGNDPMQSSECGFNEKYPRVHNGITDADYSINVGIQHLASCLNDAKVASSGDTEHISLALQGYNYGNGYISWANEHFGGYTRANAKVFSDEMKAKLKTNVYGDPDYVAHVLRYYHIGNNNIVEVAKSQVGTTSGSKYWTWYGFNKKVNWCAIFVSWCANESGMLDDSSVPKFSLCTDGENWYKKNNRWKDKSYVPMTGNIIFFDWQRDGHTDHVGIVEKVENGKVFTIEGNSKDEVKEKSYNLSSKSIYGYGV